MPTNLESKTDGVAHSASIRDVINFSLLIEKKKFKEALDGVVELLKDEPENKLFLEYRKLLTKAVEELLESQDDDSCEETSSSESEEEDNECKLEGKLSG